MPATTTRHQRVPIPPCPCRECVRHRLTYGTRTFDADGYCPDGFDRDGYDTGGYDIDGFNRAGQDEDGYNRDGYNENGYNRDGYNSDGYDEDGYDEDGYNSDGYDRDGYNSDGYDRDGYNRDGYNSDGYNEDGYDEDGYNEDGYDRRGYTRSGSCCDSPQLTFAIRNDGSEPLANDTRTTITLPSGTISAEGLAEIRDYLRSQGLHHEQRSRFYGLAYDLGTLGSQWQTETGNFTKRLSRHAYKTWGIKLTPEVMSQVGCIARDHSKQVDVSIEITRDLNMRPADFANDDSCWWGSYSESRCALKTNGGFGLRAFSGYGSVNGRAWVMPLRQRSSRLVPTFDALAPDAFAVFNGYGDLSDYAAPRIMAHLAGWTYRKISFSCRPMYVNGDSGYLVAPEPITKQYTGGLDLSVRQHATLFDTEQAAKAEKETADVRS